MYKKFCIQVISIIIIILMIIGIITWIVDPFFQYHKPFMNIYIGDERYQNPGILKNFDYNTIITGSSMVENFRVSWFENEEDKVVKVPYSGGYSKNYEIVLDLAFSSQEIKTVYLGLDIFNIFNKDENSTSHPLPNYLYDNNILNDVQYIFNKDVFYDFTLYNIKNLILGKEQDSDLAYNWNKNYIFEKEQVLKYYNRPKISATKQDEKFYMSRYDENMKNITKYIEKYSNTKFKIFIPPYSILFWDNTIRTGGLDALIMTHKTVIQDLLDYQNVEIYYFQNKEEIIISLDNYKDYTHYKEKINYYMYECMCKTGDCRITKENYIDEINKMYDIAISYDYDKLFNY